jgi:hypothetical protein
VIADQARLRKTLAPSKIFKMEKKNRKKKSICKEWRPTRRVQTHRMKIFTRITFSLRSVSTEARLFNMIQI